MGNFRKEVLKVTGPRVHKNTGSFGVYDVYKWIRKNKWLNIGRPLTEHEFYTIIRQVNNCLAEEFLKGNDIVFPYKMGKVELRKKEAVIKMENGRVITNLPVDWDRTLKLWAEDKEAYEKKILVKAEEKNIFRVLYNKRDAIYENKSFFSLDINRDLKRGLKAKIKNKTIDAFRL